MHPLKLSQCAPENGIMWEDRCAVLGAVMAFRELCHPAGCWGKRTVHSQLMAKESPVEYEQCQHTGLRLMVFSAELDRPHEPHREPTSEPKWEAHSCRVPVRVHSSLGPGSCQRYVPMRFCFCSCALFGESLYWMPVLTQKVPDLRRNRSLALLLPSSASLFCPSAEAVQLCIHASAEIWTCIEDTDLRHRFLCFEPECVKIYISDQFPCMCR